MPTANYKSYTFTHEFGHIVESYSLRDNLTKQAAVKINNDIINIAIRQTGLERKVTLSMVSHYGKTPNKPLECFAEAFANAFCGKPNAIGKAIRT